MMAPNTSQRKAQFGRFDQVVERIRAAFPTLTLLVERNDQNVNASAKMPRQPGLEFDVAINLQNTDELHLLAGKNFWTEWFPCDDDQVFEEFVRAAIGVLSGEYRIVETRVMGRAVAATLQRPDRGGGWRDVAGSSNLGWFLPLPRKRTVLQNVRSTPASGRTAT